MCQNFLANTKIPEFYALFLFGFTVALFIIAMIYILGEAFSSAQTKTFAKEELFHYAATIFISILLLFFISLGCEKASIIPNVENINGPDLNIDKDNDDVYTAGAKYLDFMVKYSFRVFYDLRAIIGKYEIKASKLSFTVESIVQFIMGAGYTTMPGAGWHGVINAYSMLLNLTMVSMFNAFGLRYLLEFIKEGMLFYLIPLGIIMRTLPGMREFGGALIAAASALFVLFPMAVLLNGMVFADISSGSLPPHLSEDFSESEIGNVYTYVSNIIIGCLFLPAIGMLLIAAFARDISILIGSEINISRLAYMM